MGKRIIITEEEKKNILSLYEENYGLFKKENEFLKKYINNENTNVVPPSESVLVANKNPFKYSEFEKAKQEYSSVLKDGDMFYILNITKFNQYKKDIINKFNENFFNDLNNKTVRVVDEYLDGSTNDYTLRFVGPVKKNMGVSELIIGIEINDTKTIYPYIINMVKNNSKYDKIFFMYDTLSTIKPAGTPSEIEIHSQKIDDLYMKKYQELVEPKLDKVNAPDEYFEIRKIQRKQTDL